MEDIEIFNPTLQAEFISSLKGCGIDLTEYIPQSQSYLATKNRRQFVLLIHESNKDKWWGIHKNFIKKIEETEWVKNKKVLWGAVFFGYGPP